MQAISKYNKETRFVLFVFDVYSKYAWVIPSKDKKGQRNTKLSEATL